VKQAPSARVFEALDYEAPFLIQKLGKNCVVDADTSPTVRVGD
jgi:hypothetical protein